MSFLVLVVLPILKFFYNAVSHQGLLGNFAMRIRWQAHRYLLRQSVDFFQNDFAGRMRFCNENHPDFGLCCGLFYRYVIAICIQ